MRKTGKVNSKNPLFINRERRRICMVGDYQD